MCTRAVGALGHYLERAGIPTTQISLIREHSERIAPPRALWVPFDLGLPFGVPHDASFQTRVLEAALQLFDSRSGPVLVDFPDDAPDVKDEGGVWACPLPLDAAATQNPLEQAFAREFAQLLPWYTLAAERAKRTTVGVSGLPLEEIGSFVCGFSEPPFPSSPSPDLSLAVSFKLAAEDLKALYAEAALAQPSERRASADEIAAWFWNETRAGELLRSLRQKLVHSDDAALKLVALLMLVPMSEWDVG